MFVIEDVKIGKKVRVIKAKSNTDEGFSCVGIVSCARKNYVRVKFLDNEEWFSNITGLLVEFTEDNKIKRNRDITRMPVFICETLQHV